MRYLEKFNFRRCYIVYPNLVVVVGVYDKRHRANFMSCVWNTALSFDPPLYGVSISPTRATYDLILSEGSFSVCFYPFDKIEDVEFFGVNSYREVDKVKERNIKLLESRKMNVPIPADSYCVFECGLYDYKIYGDHTLFVGRIELIHYDEQVTLELFDMPMINLKKVKPVLYLGKGVYITVDENTYSDLRD